MNNRKTAKELWRYLKPGICALGKFSDSTGTWLLFWEVYDNSDDHKTVGDWTIAMLEKQLNHVKSL